jgi:hypothetical protein
MYYRTPLTRPVLRASGGKGPEPMELKAGVRLRSVVGETEVIVVRAPNETVTLTAGGVPMVGTDEEASSGTVEAGHEGAVQLGKRYVDDQSGIEVLCTKPGEGALAVDGRLLTLKAAKPLPSSD